VNTPRGGWTPNSPRCLPVEVSERRGLYEQEHSVRRMTDGIRARRPVDPEADRVRTMLMEEEKT